MMMKNIAVALTGVDQVQRVPADLTESVQPGTTVDFLIPTKVRKAVWAHAQLTALVSHDSIAVRICEQQWRFEIEREQDAAERRVAPLREALAAKGADLRIHIYAGSLKKVLKDLLEIRRAPFVVICVREEWRWLKALRVRLASLGLFKPAPLVEISLAYRRNT